MASGPESEQWRKLFASVEGPLRATGMNFEAIQRALREADEDVAAQAVRARQFRSGISNSATSRRSTPTVTVVISAKNDARNIERIFTRLPSTYEVILVDGLSDDDTVSVARRTRRDIKIIKESLRGGAEALIRGFEAATGDIIVMLHADGSTDPVEIPDFVRALTAGADFVKGSRFVGTGSGSEAITRLRRFGNYMLTAITNAALRTSYTDLCFGYCAFWRDVLLSGSAMKGPAPSGSLIQADVFELETMMTLRSATTKLVVMEIPCFERSRTRSQGNRIALRDGWRVVKMVHAERRRFRRIGGESLPSVWGDHSLGNAHVETTAPDVGANESIA